MDTWAELWWRWGEELRAIRRDALQAIGDPSASTEALKFYLTTPGWDGRPRLSLPKTFDLDDATQYFTTDILARQERSKERAL